VSVSKLAGFRSAVGHFYAGAIANGPIAAAGAIACFENCAGVTGFLQFPGRHHSGDTSAKDDHTFAFAGVCCKRNHAGVRGRNGQQAERLHHHVSGAKPAGLPYLGEESASGGHKQNSQRTSI
jgi:hypothetical protein